MAVSIDLEMIAGRDLRPGDLFWCDRLNGGGFAIRRLDIEDENVFAAATYRGEGFADDLHNMDDNFPTIRQKYEVRPLVTQALDFVPPRDCRGCDLFLDNTGLALVLRPEAGRGLQFLSFADWTTGTRGARGVVFRSWELVIPTCAGAIELLKVIPPE